MNVLRFFNRQKTRKVDVRFLTRITRYLLQEMLQETTFELGIHLVDPPEMTRINESFLQHEGSTDVITFDNSQPNEGPQLCGELFISISDALGFARQFRTNWQSETARYIVHGILHLKGYDDLKPALRRTMKREENRLVKLLAQKFSLDNIGKPESRPAQRGVQRSPKRKATSIR